LQGDGFENAHVAVGVGRFGAFLAETDNAEKLLLHGERDEELGIEGDKFAALLFRELRAVDPGFRVVEINSLGSGLALELLDRAAIFR